MPRPPACSWQDIGDEICWTVDWRRFFGQMRGFHVVFRVRIRQTGVLVFWSDDGCVIRREGTIIHSDYYHHHALRSEIAVRRGDVLEVAVFQHQDDWLWGCRILTGGVDAVPNPLTVLLPYLDAVTRRLRHPNGPPLKFLSDGRAPARSVLSLYSLLLNGYAPERVQIFGQHQWDDAAASLFAALCPFAQIVPTELVLRNIRRSGGPQLTEMAVNYWWVMKACLQLLYAPRQYCFMDDDVFVLDAVDDALEAFRSHDFVFTPNPDNTWDYLDVWGPVHGRSGHFPTGTLNCGFYWLRHGFRRTQLARQMIRVPPASVPSHVWEQGYLASLLADQNLLQLPGQRYLLPLEDGLPGGECGYDYVGNPCGMTAIHFAGIAKPGDGVALALAPQILDRHNSPCRRQ